MHLMHASMHHNEYLPHMCRLGESKKSCYNSDTVRTQQKRLCTRLSVPASPLNLLTCSVHSGSLPALMHVIVHPAQCQPYALTSLLHPPIAHA